MKLDKDAVLAGAQAGYEARVGEYLRQQPWDSLTANGHEREAEHYRAAINKYLIVVALKEAGRAQ